MSRMTSRRRVSTVVDGVVSPRSDVVIAEEPLEIRLGGKSLVITMRTPGHDFDLASGFLVSEGVVARRDDIRAIRYCAGATEDGVNTYNILDVDLDPDVRVPDFGLERSFYTTSSCGLCGKASLDAVRSISTWEVRDDDLELDPELVATYPDRLRDAQKLFERTGGLHAAGLFAPDGELLVIREDVGRHNAVDKVVGSALGDGLLPLRGSLLLVSGRVSFELVQKAVMAGIPALAAVSAPSSLAVELAEESGMTLIGFLRGTSMNLYTGEHRLRTRLASTS